MKRRLFNAIAVVSAVLCVATAVLWARSYWVEDNVQRTSPGKRVFVISDQGSILFALDKALFDHDEGGVIWWNVPVSLHWRAIAPRALEPNIIDRPTRWPLGVKTDNSKMGIRPGSSLEIARRALLIPHWIFVGGTAMLPVEWLVSIVCRRRRRRLGGCDVCGYDLRATPERCPECGAIPPSRG